TKKRLTALAAICASGFLLAACEPSAEQQSSEQTDTTTQDGASTFGQRDRDLTTPEDPAMNSPGTSQETPSTDPSAPSPDSGAATDSSSSSSAAEQPEADTAF